MDKKVLVETSARHVHLSQKDLETLFGPGAQLHCKKELSQPGQYVCEERVDIVGPKRTLTGVSVLGPVRGSTQAEISLTDARGIGVSIPIRESGDLAGSAPLSLKGPAGQVELSEGLIAAKRHIHTAPEDAAVLGVQDKEVVSVKIESEGRTAILGDVVVRVDKSYRTAMHVDTDESNACGGGTMYGEIVR